MATFFDQALDPVRQDLDAISIEQIFPSAHSNLPNTHGDITDRGLFFVQDDVLTDIKDEHLHIDVLGFFDASNHFDNSQFNSASLKIQERYDSAVDEAKGSSFSEVDLEPLYYFLSQTDLNPINQVVSIAANAVAGQAIGVANSFIGELNTTIGTLNGALGGVNDAIDVLNIGLAELGIDPFDDIGLISAINVLSTNVNLNLEVIDSKLIVRAANALATELDPGNPDPVPFDPAGPNDVADHFGQILHALQDFYSHTNWVNNGLEFLVDAGTGEFPTLGGTSNPQNIVGGGTVFFAGIDAGPEPVGQTTPLDDPFALATTNGVPAIISGLVQGSASDLPGTIRLIVPTYPGGDPSNARSLPEFENNPLTAEDGDFPGVPTHDPEHADPPNDDEITKLGSAKDNPTDSLTVSEDLPFLSPDLNFVGVVSTVEFNRTVSIDGSLIKSLHRRATDMAQRQTTQEFIRLAKLIDADEDASLSEFLAAWVKPDPASQAAVAQLLSDGVAPELFDKVMIDWGDGSPNSMIDLSTNEEDLSQLFEHEYERSSEFEFVITISTIGHDGKIAEVVLPTVTVNQVPVITELNSSNGDLDHKSADGVVTIDGKFSDPDGLLDAHMVEVDWGDGSALEPLTLTEDDQMNDEFGGTHAYADSGIYTIKVTVKDAEGAVSFESTTTAVVEGVGLVDGVLFARIIPPETVILSAAKNPLSTTG